MPRQTVLLQKAGGVVSRAELVAEIILLDDGRTNGGFGVWETYPLGAPSLYRVVSGKRRGSVSTFNAVRLSPQPALESTISLEPIGDVTPTGSVTFLVDGIPTADGTPATLMANGRSEKAAGTISVLDASFTFVHVNAPPQIVEIASATDLVLANLNTVALIFPTAGAMGFLRIMPASGGATEAYYGTGVYKSIDGGRSWMLAASAENPFTPGYARMIMIRPLPDPTEVCRIYDVVGPQVNSSLHFEAETDVTSFKLGES